MRLPTATDNASVHLGAETRGDDLDTVNIRLLAKPNFKRGVEKNFLEIVG
jgi:hypothetical protein